MRSGDPEEQRAAAGEFRPSGGGWQLPPATVDPPPADPAGPRGPYRPLGRRAQLAVGLLLLGIAADGAALVSGLMERSMLTGASAGQFLTEAEANANDHRQLVVASVQLAVFAAVAVAFLLWFHRAYRNLSALGAGRLRFGPGWAIGAWFVPILNLWRPLQIANDVWRTSDPALPVEGAPDWRSRPTPALYVAWWTPYVLIVLVNGVSLQLTLSAVTVDELLAANAAALVGTVITILGGVLTVVVVRRTTTRQTARAGQLALEHYREPAPLGRRRSTWVALGVVVAGIVLQAGLVWTSWTALGPGEDAPAAVAGSASGPPPPLAPDGAPADALLADDFSRQGIWEVADEPAVTMDYVNRRYRIVVVEPRSFWYSSQLLPSPASGLSVEVDAMLFEGVAELDSYGVMCLRESGAYYFFGISPDGYHAILFDPDPTDADAEVERLVETTAVGPFAGEREFAALRAECVNGEDGTRLALGVNGDDVAETVHPGGEGDFVAVALFAYSEEGGTDVRFDDIVVRELGSR